MSAHRSTHSAGDIPAFDQSPVAPQITQMGSMRKNTKRKNANESVSKSVKRPKAAAVSPLSTMTAATQPSPSLENMSTATLEQVFAELQRRRTEFPISENQLVTPTSLPFRGINSSYTAFTLAANNTSPRQAETLLLDRPSEQEPLGENFNVRNLDPALWSDGASVVAESDPEEEHPVRKVAKGYQHFQRLFQIEDKREYLDFRESVRHAIVQMGLDFSKPYGEQSVLVLSNIVRRVQDEYHQFAAPEWEKDIKDFMGDIVRNRRRKNRQRERQENANLPVPKRGRPFKSHALNKRQSGLSTSATKIIDV